MFAIIGNTRNIKFISFLRINSQVALVVKNLPANAGDEGLIPGLGRSPGGEMATHCSILARIIPWTDEPGGLRAMEMQKVRLN